MKKIILVSVLAASLAAGSAFAFDRGNQGEIQGRGVSTVKMSILALMSGAVSAGDLNKAGGATDSPSFSFPAGRSINSGHDLVKALKSAGKPASKSSGLEIKLKKSIARDILVAEVKIDKISTFCAASPDTGKTGPQGNTISCSTIQASAEAAAAAIGGAQASMATCTADGTSSQDCLKSGVKTNFCS